MNPILENTKLNQLPRCFLLVNIHITIPKLSVISFIHNEEKVANNL